MKNKIKNAIDKKNLLENKCLVSFSLTPILPEK